MSLTLAVGLSGGLDSTVLLHLMCRMRERLPHLFNLQAIHVHHGLQPAADEFAAHCEHLCQSLSVPLTLHRLSIALKAIHDLGVEAAARKYRYEAIASNLSDGAILVLGHHRDDLLETALLQWIRGAGLEGLSAMKRLSAIDVSGRKLIRWRPLLDQSRQSLVAYAHAEGLTWVEDPTNTEDEFARNRIRQEVMPVLKSLREGADTAMARSISHLQTARELLDLVTEQALKESLHAEQKGVYRELCLARLLGFDEALAVRVVRAWLRSEGAPIPPARRLAEFMRQLREAREPFARMDLVVGRAAEQGWSVCRDRDCLKIAR